MTTSTYRGCEFTRTNTTTDVRRQAFGQHYTAIARVWGVSGRLGKSACKRPFLTSASDCREWVREQDDLAEYRDREYDVHAELDRAGR